MAETHELRLKINAAAARSGAREFVAALSSIKTAIRQLDRDSNGVFTRLNKNLKDAGSSGRAKINIVDRTSLRNLQSYSKLAQDAIKSTANTSRSVANLSARMQALSSSYATARGQADAFASSVSRLNTQLSRQAGATMPRTAAAPTGGGGARAGADQAVVAQERIQRAVEQSRLSVERLTTQLMKLGGFQSIGNLGNAFRDFQRQVANGSMSASEFSRAMGGMRSAITNTQTSLTTLSAKTRDQASADRASVKASSDRARALDAATSATNRAELETAKLINRLRAVGDVRGIDTLNNAMMRLRTSMSGSVGSVQQVKSATNEFANATTRLKVGLAASEGAQMKQARSARQVAAGAASAAAATKALERDMRSAAGAANAADKSFRNATGGMRGLENAFSGGFQAASLFRTALGSITLGSFTKAVFTAGDALQQFNITMEVASGSAEAAADDLSYINDLAQDLGTNLGASRDAFSKFAVSAQIAGVSGDQTRQIFDSVSTAMAVLGRGTEDQRLAFLALEQMMSKGVISAEELRRQLGERLPGAVNLMARAVGVSTSELQDMLKAGELISSEVLPKFAAELDKTFGSQLSRTFNRAGSNLGRLQTQFSLLLETVADSGFLDVLSDQFKDLATLMKSSDVQAAARRLGEGLADGARLAGDALQFLITNLDTVAAVVKNVILAVVIGAFSRMGAALAISGQQALIAVNSLSIFAGASRKAAVDAALLAKSTTGASAGLTGMAAAGGRAGLMLGALGRGLGFLGGPMGLVLGAFTLAPMIFDKFSNSIEGTAEDYRDSIRDMETTTFRFFDRVRAEADKNAAELILGGVSDIGVTDRDLNAARGDTNAQDTVSATISSLASDNVGLQGTLKTISDMYDKLVDTSTPLSDAVKTVANLKAQMELLRGSVDEVDAQALATAMQPVAQAILNAENALKRLKSSAGNNTEELLALATAAQEADANITGIYQGLAGNAELPIAEDIKALLSQIDGGGGLVDVLDQLSLEFFNIGASTDDLSIGLDTLQNKFDNNEISVADYTVKLSELVQNINSTVLAQDSASNASENQRARVDELVQIILQLIPALEDNADAANAARVASEGLAGGIASAGNAATTAVGQINAYTESLREAQRLSREIQTTAGDLIAENSLRLELTTMAPGVERDVFEELNLGQTADEVKKLDEQIATLRDTVNTTMTQGASAPFGIDPAEARSALEAAIASRDEFVETSEALVRAQFAEAEANKAASGSKKQDLTALQEFDKATKEHIQSLQEQNIANTLLASGMTKSADAANIVAAAQVAGANLTQEQTIAFLQQAEAAELLAEKLSELANDPVNDFMNSVPSWRSAGQQIETEVFESLSDQIAKFAQTGKFSFEELGASILATATEIIADKAVKELVTMMGGNTTGTGEGGFGLGGILSDLFGNGGSAGDEGDPMAAGFDGQAAGQQISMAMQQGAQAHAQAIQQAMMMATQQMTTGMTMGGAQASQQVTTGITTGAATAAPTLSTSLVTGATGAAPILSAATAAGGISGATAGAGLLGAGVEAGSQTGGGFFAQMIGGLFGGGGGGGGGLGGLFSMLLPVLFGSGGGTTSGGPSMPSVMAPATMFKGAPSYAAGTANTTGGVPAILHANEAVVPLTGGRKIPIEGGGAGGGGQTVVQNFNITTPNADSFRKSQSQIAADAAASGQRAMSRNR